jgi:hypothetical protein
MNRFAVFMLCNLAFCSPPGLAGIQLDAPGALSDYSGCEHNTCLWVPFNNPSKKFHRGDITYYVTPFSDTGGNFVLERNGTQLLSAELKDLDASVSVVWNQASTRLAVTWSDGGAIGNFHVRVFEIDAKDADELPSTATAVTEFKARHYCEARGDNTQAYTWIGNDELVLVTSVYNTSDCGPDLGHLEAYVVNASSGAILRHMNLAAFNRFAKAHPE